MSAKGVADTKIWIMKDDTKNLNTYLYRYKDGNENFFICQYMRLDYFIKMLENQHYYAKRRRIFNDAHETQRKLLHTFNSVGNKTEEKEREYANSNIVNCPTACWTKNSQESYLMWKSYATEMGVCIRSNVHDFIASLKIDLNDDSENKIVCGSMDYGNHFFSLEEEKQLFDKDIEFADENEFRFYFMLASDTDKTTSGFSIPINPEVLIDDILLSPFIDNDAARSISQIIKQKYNINVKQSRIKLQ